MVSSESGTADGSGTESESNANNFPHVYKKAAYPLFYNELICSDKEHSEVTEYLSQKSG